MIDNLFWIFGACLILGILWSDRYAYRNFCCGLIWVSHNDGSRSVSWLACIWLASSFPPIGCSTWEIGCINTLFGYWISIMIDNLFWIFGACLILRVLWGWYSHFIRITSITIPKIRSGANFCTCLSNPCF